MTPAKTTRATPITLIVFFLMTSWAAAGCLGPLDALGYESGEYERESLFREPEIQDDRIEDKDPSYDPSSRVEELFGTCQVVMNKSGTVTKLDIVPFEEDNADLEERLFPTRAEALVEVGSRGGGEIIPSLEVINGAMKTFNDGLYASIEVGMQDGIPEVYPSRREFLYALAEALQMELDASSGNRVGPLQSALGFVAGALMAGGNEVESLNLDAPILQIAQDELALFEGDTLHSTPMGFYTWDATLQEVFKQDRFCQNRTHQKDKSVEVFGRYAAIAAVLQTPDATELKAQYEGYLAVYAGLTNPYVSYTPAHLFDYVTGPEALDDVAGLRQEFLSSEDAPYVCRGTYFALFPASRAKDTDFFKELFCEDPLPADVNLIDVLINAIRDGVLDITPDESSGWYDYQLHAMGILLVPEEGAESDHLLLTAAYKKKLIETFKSLITQARETHAKSLEDFGSVGVAAPPTPVDIYPKFPVEPFPTFYLRTARAYRFLGSYLEAVLGSEFMSSTYRMFEGNEATEMTLTEELRKITLRTYGFFVLSARSVGLEPSEMLLEGETEQFPIADAVLTARDWLVGWQEDADVLRDPRVIVPVGYDLVTNESINWAVLGVKAVRVYTEFVEGYEPEVVNPGDGCELRDILPHHYYLLVEVMREVRIPLDVPPLTRDEFRAICSQHDNADDIVAALEALQ